jgi:hypothetical protein
MASLLVCTQPATGHPGAFIFQEGPALLLKRLSAAPHLSRVTPASRLELRPAVETVSSGVPEIDALTGGLPRGCLSEIYGPASSGRTSLLLSAVAATTRRGEVCALVDVSDAFDPQSAAAARVKFENLLWVRCEAESREKKRHSPRRHQGTEFDGKRVSFSESRDFCEHRLEQTLKATDLLLQSGGFGMVAIDLGDLPWQAARRIPLTSWFRFRRAVENTPTILLVIGQGPCARTCASLLLRLEMREHNFGKQTQGSVSAPENPTHTQLLDGLSITAELLRSRMERKPSQSVAAFASRTAWAG